MSKGIGISIGIGRRSTLIAGLSGPSAPSAFVAGQISALDSPSAGGDRGLLRVASAPFDGGSAITTMYWQVDSGSGYGSTQSAAWVASFPTDYPFTVLAGVPATVRVWLGNAVGQGPVLNLAPFIPTVSGAAGAPTVSATGLAPPAITAYREHTGTTTYDTTLYFGAETATSYVLATPVLGVSINSSTGLLTVDHTLARVGAYDLVVFKFNATGVAHSEIAVLNVLSPRTLQAPQRWGASTPAGKGALNTNLMVGGPLADGTYTTGNYSYTVASGIMTPLATATPGSYTIGGLGFTIFAGRTASTIAELQAAISDGIRIETRGPTAGGTLSAMVTADLTSRFSGFTTETTLTNADTYDETLSRPSLSNFAFNGAPANLTVDGWNFRGTTSAVAKDLSDMTVSTRYACNVVGAVTVKFKNCAFTSNTPNAYMTGLRPSVGIPGLIVTSCAGLIVEDCYFAQVYNSMNVTNGAGHYDITFQRNKVWGVFADGLYSGGSDGSGGEAVNLQVLNNDFAHFIGDHGFHSDMMQFAPTVTDRNCTGIVVRGNSFEPGLIGLLAPAWPTVGAGGGYPQLPLSKSTPKTASYTAPTTSFHHDVDPTAGAITVQLPVQTVKTRNGVQKWGRSPNTVTVLPPAGTQILLGSTLYDSITLVDPWEFMRFQYNDGTGRYDAVAQTNAYQGIFTNNPPGSGQYVNFLADHNLIGSTIAPADVTDYSASGSWFNSNTCIPPFPGKLLSSGRTNSAAQGFDPSNQYLITIGSNATMHGNVAGSLTTGGTQENPGVNNYPMWQTAGAKTYAAINALFTAKSQDSSQTAQHIPMTRAEHIAAARPRAGTALSDIGMGAGLAVNSADDKYDFAANGFKNNLPWQVRRPAISTSTGGGTVTWLAPAYLGDGAITSYDLRHKINGGGYTTVTGTTSPATITGQPSGSLVVEIRANNANGNGPWTVMTAVSITGTGDTAPAVNVVGSISGNAYTTATLTSTAATFTGSPAPTVTRQWYKFTTATETNPANGTALGTASTQAMSTAEEGYYIRCRTIGTNTAGVAYDMSAASARIGIAGLGQSINADGVFGTYASPPTFNPTGAPEYVTVASPGFDSTGAATTQYRNITWMKRVRQASPNQNTLSTDQVAPSDYIYSGDTVLGMTNNSALAAPLPIAMWLTPDLEIINSSTCTLRWR